ncbi:hypothetical protein SEA_HFRANCETTE_51 [Streptomyces phage HFrancette]|uniref:Uncharacterized protein n=2 Tax=Ignaciovirus TaxID=3152509 RepID=A0A9E7NIN2_9CAUD|nr:hypothetical protein QEN60_gp50 [Streptomyces phage Ignacio]YP_010756402.1 hypothetical protein QEN64_gp51 [Streptomyces phage HFrancette]QKN87577.1 hypothetical protein SEA_IGNACIO_50 [Streptomyces phage Ignacio]UTN92145.1 hypothetical protein SEA_HFRANCETTE_51 [Streptomyces phage HFrancette]
MTTTPADELRAAAARLRALATAASTDTDGTPTTTWSAKLRRPADPDGTSRLYGDHRTREDGRRIAWPPLLRGGSQQRPTHMHTQHADYIVAMGPATGLAIAYWLDAVAARLSRTTHPDWQADIEPHAVAVARQLLGTSAGTVAQPAPAVTEEPGR